MFVFVFSADLLCDQLWGFFCSGAQNEFDVDSQVWFKPELYWSHIHGLTPVCDMAWEAWEGHREANGDMQQHLVSSLILYVFVGI